MSVPISEELNMKKTDLLFYFPKTLLFNFNLAECVILGVVIILFSHVPDFVRQIHIDEVLDLEK